MSLRAHDLDAILEVVPDPMLAFRADGKIVAASRRTCELFGFERRALAGTTATKLVPERHRVNFAALVSACFDGLDPEASQHNCIGRRASGEEFPFRVHLGTADVDGTPVGLASIHDSTESASAREGLHHARRMEALGRLASGIGHDFNNLLTVILCNCQMLSENLEEGSDETELVEGIHAAATHAISLTRQLMARGSEQSGTRDRIDLNGIVLDAEKTLARLVGHEVEVLTKTDAALTTVRADPGQIEQVLVNLTVNARDAMPRGGHLVIETGMAERVDEKSGQRRRFARLSVLDDGIGMDEATAAKAFEPFFTTKEAGRGTGLGLVMVRNIVEAYGGVVELSSAPGEGTTVDVYLPCESVRTEPDSTESRTFDQSAE